MRGPIDGTFGGATPADSPILCLALGQEIRRVAFAETRHGDGMIWLLAQLTADRPEFPLSGIILRLGAALMASNAPAIWDHARSEISDMESPPRPGDAADEPTPKSRPDPGR